MPTSEEFARLHQDDFRDYRLCVYGEVENPVELSLDQIKAKVKHQQITLHNCIPEWLGIAEWGGIQMPSHLELVRPHPNAKYTIVYWRATPAGREPFETNSQRQTISRRISRYKRRRSEKYMPPRYTFF